MESKTSRDKNPSLRAASWYFLQLIFFICGNLLLFISFCQALLLWSESGVFTNLEIGPLRIGGLEFQSARKIEVRDITVNTDQVRLSVDSLFVRYQITRLLTGKIDQFHILHPKLLELNSAASTEDTTAQTSEPSVVDLRDLFNPLTIYDLRVEDLELEPFGVEAGIQLSLLGNKLQLHQFRASLEKEEVRLNLRDFELSLKDKIDLSLEHIIVHLKEKKLIHLKEYEGSLPAKLDPKALNLGRHLVRSISVTLPEAEEVETEIEEEPLQAGSNTSSDLLDLRKEILAKDIRFVEQTISNLQTQLSTTIPRSLPFSLESFELQQIQVPELEAGIENLKLSFLNQKLKLNLIAKHQKTIIPVSMSYGLAHHSFLCNIPLDLAHQLQLGEEMELQLSNKGALELKLEEFNDKGSYLNLDVILNVITPEFTNKIPVKLTANIKGLNLESPSIEWASLQSTLKTSAGLQFLLQDAGDFQLLSSLKDTKFYKGTKAQIEKSALHLNVKFSQNLNKIVVESNSQGIKENIFPSLAKIEKQNFRLVVQDLDKVDLEFLIPAIQSTDIQIKTIRAKLTGSILDTLTGQIALESMKSEPFGNLTSLTMDFTVKDLELNGRYELKKFSHLDSKVEKLSGSISANGKGIRGETIIPGSTIHPRQFTSFSRALAYIPKSEGSTQAATTTTSSSDFGFVWKVHSPEKAKIHILDEMAVVDLQPDMKFDLQTGLQGTLRVLHGTFYYSNRELRILETGYVKFWPAQSNLKSKKSMNFSTTATNLVAQLVHLWKQNSEFHAQEALGLRESIEVNFKLSMPWQGETLVLKVSGMYPDYKIRVFDESGAEIPNGILGILQQSIKGATQGSGDSAQVDKAQLLSQQASQMANSQIDGFFNDKLKGQGLKLKSSFVPGGSREFGIEKRITNRISVEYNRSQNENEAVIQTQKIQYELRSKASIYFRQDTSELFSEPDSSFGLQRRIKF